jgi:hypothetical protein
MPDPTRTVTKAHSIQFYSATNAACRAPTRRQTRPASSVDASTTAVADRAFTDVLYGIGVRGAKRPVDGPVNECPSLLLGERTCLAMTRRAAKAGTSSGFPESFAALMCHG